MVLRLVEVVRVKTIPSKAGGGVGRGGVGSVMDGGKRDERGGEEGRRGEERDFSPLLPSVQRQ